MCGAGEACAACSWSASSPPHAWMVDTGWSPRRTHSPVPARQQSPSEPSLPPGPFVLPGSLDLSQRRQAVATSHSLEDGWEARVPLSQRTVPPLWTRLSSVPRTLTGLHPWGLGSQLVRASRGFIHRRKTSQMGCWA